MTEFNTKKFIISSTLGLIAFLGLGYIADAIVRVEENIIPRTNNAFDLGTSTPSRTWKAVYSQQFIDTGASNGCAQFTSGVLDSTGVACGSGLGGSYPFTPTTVGSTIYEATTSQMYFSGGFLTGTSTIGTLTATSSANFLAGLTITCTGCVTDANVADLAVGGDVTGTLSNIAVTDDSHAHTATTISGLGTDDISGLDISADTNLTAGDGITLSDDDLDCDTASATAFGCLSTATFGIFNNKFGGTYSTTFATSTFATSTSIWLQGGAIYASSTATSTFDGGLSVGGGGLASSNGLTITGGSINLSSSATSTFNNGIELTGGCYKKAGACLTEVSSSLTGILEEAGGVVSTVTIGSGLDYTGTTLSIGTVGIADGGTNATAQTTNGVNYFNGTSITSGTQLIFDGTNFGIATGTPGSLLSIQSIGNFAGGTSTIYSNLSVGNLTATNTLSVSGSLNFNGVSSATWAGFCQTITGGAGLCDGTDATGAGGGTYAWTPITVGSTIYQATTSPMYFSAGFLTGTSTIGTLTATSSFAVGTTTLGTLLNVGNALNVSNATSTFYSALKGGKQTLLQFTAQSGVPPGTAFAAFDTRNAHTVLDFQEVPTQEVLFSGVMPQIYSGKGVYVRIHFAMSTTTSQSVQWDVAFERILAGTDDVDNFGFAATSTATVTSDGTSGVLSIANIQVSDGTNMDSIQPGDYFRIRVSRNAATDSGTGDAELYLVEIREQ